IFLQIFNAWYDTGRDKARPIAELITELDSGLRQPADGTNPFGVAWSELDDVQRRRVIDAHRLVYRSESSVYWSPCLGTVLSNE
ncbi:MAG: leuS, partial [Pseudonocardiales bacterium]|nr:leuS [Pseudonocardiales bacterium]